MKNMSNKQIVDYLYEVFTQSKFEDFDREVMVPHLEGEEDSPNMDDVKVNIKALFPKFMEKE